MSSGANLLLKFFKIPSKSKVIKKRLVAEVISCSLYDNIRQTINDTLNNHAQNIVHRDCDTINFVTAESGILAFNPEQHNDVIHFLM